MTRKIFWSVFSLFVLYAGIAFTNFSSSAKIEEALRDMGGDAMPVGPYAQKVVKFYNENKRWPTATEVVLPEPLATGIVRSVELEPDGVLVLKLPGLFWLQPIQVKVAVILQPGPEYFGWTSACLDATPRGIARMIFAHCSGTTMAKVQETQQRVIAIQNERLKEGAVTR